MSIDLREGDDPESRWRVSMSGQRRVSFHLVCLSAGLFLILTVCGISRQAVEDEMRAPPDETVSRTTSSAPMPWLDQPAGLWQRDFSGSPRPGGGRPAVIHEDSMPGARTRVHGLFDRWTFPDSVTAGRGRHWAEITDQCRQQIELDYVLTAGEWRRPEVRERYYRDVNALIEHIGAVLLADFGDQLEGREREYFLRALKTLAWQESRWQHYLTLRVTGSSRFFVIVSGGSYNQLDDWGITQIARSSFDPQVLLNTNFFDSRAYCSISSSLYYGFMEYYFCYLEAREHPDNGPGLFNRVVGAYNRYSSGYSASCFQLADDSGYRSYQIRAMGGFKDRFISQPWREAMGRNSDDAAHDLRLFGPATFSIAARDSAAGELGVAVASRFFAVGSVVPWAEAGVGAVATQAFANTSFGWRGLELLANGLTPQEAVDVLIRQDDDPGRRQLGIVSADGLSATYTGQGCLDWAGGRSGPDYAIQGNILAGPQVVAEMEGAFLESTGTLAERLYAALTAGERAGGDVRGKQSAALLVVREGAGYGGYTDRAVDIRVDDHAEPFRELGRLLTLALVNDNWNRAWTLFTRREFDQALPHMERTAELAPKHAEVLYDLAVIRLAAGRPKKALQALTRSLAINPRLKDQAAVDEDLAGLRNDPEFQKLVGP
jgi:uncharacterized Ntn-hydrolase superfamily protein